MKQAVLPVKAWKVPLKCHDHKEGSPGADEDVAEAAVLRNFCSASRFACIVSCSSCRHASHANRFTRSSTKDSDSSCIASTNRHSGDWEIWHYLDCTKCFD
ncbi:UNVERIFIED_CONTAM: hypothetical protein FKN15_036202 [Acipenser sinensis]